MTSLIHNGVISNTEELEYYQSTCDSEGILTKYVEKEILKNVPCNFFNIVTSCFSACFSASLNSTLMAKRDFPEKSVARYI